MSALQRAATATPEATSSRAAALIVARGLSKTYNGTLALDPYPFDQPLLTTNVIFRRLTQDTFKDSAELQSAYFKTAPQIASFKLVPG